MKNKFVALVTARGGSKGLPRKNVLPINGIPLIGLTINAAKQSTLVSDVYVSTEDSEIAKVSEQFGAKVIPRPALLATDTASSIDVVSHSISWLEHQDIRFEKMVLLQPTSPLRTCEHLDNALIKYTNSNASLVVSVYEPEHTPIKAYLEEANGSIRGLYSNRAPYERRQDLPRAFQPNGAIYAFSVDEFKKINHFPISNVFPFVMSKKDSLDIDTIEDFKLVEKRFKELNK